MRLSFVRFLEDLTHEIAATPTGHRREILTELQIHVMHAESELKKLESQSNDT